jgi:hypothetical protein
MTTALVTGTTASASTTAAVHRITVHEVLGWCKAGDTMGIDGRTYKCVRVTLADAPPTRRLRACERAIAAATGDGVKLTSGQPALRVRRDCTGLSAAQTAEAEDFTQYLSRQLGV